VAVNEACLEMVVWRIRSDWPVIQRQLVDWKVQVSADDDDCESVQRLIMYPVELTLATIAIPAMKTKQ